MELYHIIMVHRNSISCRHQKAKFFRFCDFKMAFTLAAKCGIVFFKDVNVIKCVILSFYTMFFNVSIS